MNAVAAAMVMRLLVTAPFASGSEIENAATCADPVELENRPRIPEGFVFDVIMRNRAWLIDGWCPQQVVLLGMEPILGVATNEFSQIKAALEADGCTVIEETEEQFRDYLNPKEDEWQTDKLKGAISAAVSSCFNRAGDLAIRIGWYKGTLHAKSTTVLFRWNGEGWVERTVKIVTMS